MRQNFNPAASAKTAQGTSIQRGLSITSTTYGLDNERRLGQSSAQTGCSRGWHPDLRGASVLEGTGPVLRSTASRKPAAEWVSLGPEGVPVPSGATTDLQPRQLTLTCLCCLRPAGVVGQAGSGASGGVISACSERLLFGSVN